MKSISGVLPEWGNAAKAFDRIAKAVAQIMEKKEACRTAMESGVEVDMPCRQLIASIVCASKEISKPPPIGNSDAKALRDNCVPRLSALMEDARPVVRTAVEVWETQSNQLLESRSERIEKVMYGTADGAAWYTGVNSEAQALTYWTEAFKDAGMNAIFSASDKVSAGRTPQ